MFGRGRYVFELGGLFFGSEKGRLEQLVDLRTISGDAWFISDLQESVTRAAIVEAPVRYVELLIRRQLQETGEFNEPVSVITHWKKSVGPNSTSVFYTALTTRLYNQYMDQIRESGHAIQLTPLFGALYGVLKRIAPRRPAAVVFQHDRFADLVVGGPGGVLHAVTCVAFDNSEEQISFLWETVRNEIDGVEAEQRIDVKDVYLMNWVDSGEAPEWTEQNSRRVFRLEEETVNYEGEPVSLSFIKALREGARLKSVSPRGVRVGFAARRYAAPIYLLTLLAALLLYGGHLWFSQETDVLQARVSGIRAKAAGLSTAEIPSWPEAEFSRRMDFVRDLQYCRQAPSYRNVIADLSTAMTEDMELASLKLAYEADAMTSEVIGRTDLSFNSAYPRYLRMIGTLEHQGYTVEESRLKTQITESRFLLRLKRDLQ